MGFSHVNDFIRRRTLKCEVFCSFFLINMDVRIVQATDLGIIRAVRVKLHERVRWPVPDHLEPEQKKCAILSSLDVRMTIRRRVAPGD